MVIADLALRPEAQKLVDGYTSSPKAIFVKTDVVNWDDLTNMFDVAEREFGSVDIVTPGAGVFEPHWSNFWIPPGTGASKDDVHGGSYKILDINTIHPIRTTQIAISRWLNPSSSSQGGKAGTSNPKRVVCISSIAGQTPYFAFPMYIASKHAMSGFIRSMGPLESLGIRVNGVAPGLIKTPLWTDHPEKYFTIDEEKDVWITPEEVAEQMLACAEDDKIGPAVVWEVVKDSYRKVDWRNDPGPSGQGSGLANPEGLQEEVMKWLAEPGWGVTKEMTARDPFLK